MAGSLEGNVYDGKLYGIPISGDMWVIYINKSLFEKAGVPIPTSMGRHHRVRPEV